MSLRFTWPSQNNRNSMNASLFSTPRRKPDSPSMPRSPHKSWTDQFLYGHTYWTDRILATPIYGVGLSRRSDLADVTRSVDARKLRTRCAVFRLGRRPSRRSCTNRGSPTTCRPNMLALVPLRARYPSICSRSSIAFDSLSACVPVMFLLGRLPRV